MNEDMVYFYELFEALPRGGPGDNQSTRKAFSYISNLPDNPYILDIGCGPGVQTIELARLTQGTVIALDNHQAFLDQLIQNAKREGLSDHIVPRNMSMLEMDFEDSTFDLIWSEGALYFMGFQNGLKKCRQLLKVNGFLAVTELVYLVNDPPAALAQYLEAEYPDITSIADRLEHIEQEKFHLISYFTLPKSAWLDNFYLPMETELIRLVQKYQGNSTALGVFEAMQNEISMYKKYSDDYGYAFFIIRRID